MILQCSTVSQNIHLALACWSKTWLRMEFFISFICLAFSSCSSWLGLPPPAPPPYNVNTRVIVHETTYTHDTPLLVISNPNSRFRGSLLLIDLSQICNGFYQKFSKVYLNLNWNIILLAVTNRLLSLTMTQQLVLLNLNIWKNRTLYYVYCYKC